MTTMRTMRDAIRTLVRSWWGLPPLPPRGSLEAHRARKQARLDADVRTWARTEAAAREERAFDRAMADETTRAQLERRGVLWPGE